MRGKNKKKILSNEGGNILLSALLVMLGMNLFAVLLVQIANREFLSSEYKTTNSTNFYLAETCIDEVVEWFGTQDSPPAVIPDFNRANISHLYSGGESTEASNNLAKYSYDCDIQSLTVLSTEGNELGTGNDVSINDGYGISGDLSPTYFYRIDAEAAGPRDSTKKIVAILAVEY